MKRGANDIAIENDDTPTSRRRIDDTDDPIPDLSLLRTICRVFGNRDLRSLLFPHLSLLDVLAFWTVFPFLHSFFNVYDWIWSQFKEKVLSRTGITDVSWMDPAVHAFTGSAVLEFLLEEPLPFARDLDVLICNRKEKHAFFHPFYIDNSDVQIMSIVTRFGIPVFEVQNPSDQGVFNAHCDTDYYRHGHTFTSLKVRVAEFFPRASQAQRNCVPFLDFIKTDAPTVQQAISVFDFTCCRIALHPRQITICNWDALRHRTVVYPIDEEFIHRFPADPHSQPHPMLVKDGELVVERIHKYQQRGFTIVCDRMMLLRNPEDHTALVVRLINAIRAREPRMQWSTMIKYVYDWVERIAPTIEKACLLLPQQQQQQPQRRKLQKIRTIKK